MGFCLFRIFLSRTIKTAVLAVAVIAFSSAMAEINTVQISSRLDPNAILITEVDIIFIYDAALVDDFADKKSAWYANKRQYTRSVGDAVDVLNTFVPQGFDSTMVSLPPRKAAAVKVYVFAQHDDSQAAPVDITDWIDVKIEIDPFGIVVSKLN